MVMMDFSRDERVYLGMLVGSEREKIQERIRNAPTWADHRLLREIQSIICMIDSAAWFCRGASPAHGTRLHHVHLPMVRWFV
jgi:hypothetical protein